MCITFGKFKTENYEQGEHSPGKHGKPGIPKWSGKCQGK